MSENSDRTGQVLAYLSHLRESIWAALQERDQHLQRRVDSWHRPGGGGGDSWAFTGVDLLEKGGMNISDIHGDSLPEAATQGRAALAGSPFRAVGLSLVFHSHNPYVPAVHANWRFFTADNDTWWFGGGFDLTPCYGFAEDARHWHQTARQACEPFGSDVYTRFKEWCDRYFYIRHRDEMRGIGGLFFDDLNEWGFDRCFSFVQSTGDHFLPAWLPIADRRQPMAYGKKEKEFQLYRRGRYVEFNLVYDRGTLFGLQSGGRTESILMSLPPLARWEYDWVAEPGSPEASLVEDFLQPRNWVESGEESDR